MRSLHREADSLFPCQPSSQGIVGRVSFISTSLFFLNTMAITHFTCFYHPLRGTRASQPEELRQGRYKQSLTVHPLEQEQHPTQERGMGAPCLSRDTPMAQSCCQPRRHLSGLRKDEFFQYLERKMAQPWL